MSVSVAPSGPFIQKWADGGVMVPSSAQWQAGVSGEERANSVSIPESPQNHQPAPTERTARWHSASPSHTHTRLGVTRRVKEAPLPNIPGTKRVCFSQPVRKASVRSICHHDPLLLAQCASVCLLSADLPHPHQRELPVSVQHWNRCVSRAY